MAASDVAAARARQWHRCDVSVYVFIGVPKPSARIPSSLSPVFTYSDAMAAGLSAGGLYRGDEAQGTFRDSLRGAESAIQHALEVVL